MSVSMALVTYTETQKALHWITVVLVVILVATGMADFYDIGDDFPMTLHQWSGQAMIVVLLARVAARRHRSVRPPSDHSTWEKLAAKLIHIGFYVLLAVYVMTGYVSASAFSDPELIWSVDRAFSRSDIGDQLLELHYRLKWVLLAVAGLHISAVLKHVVVDRDQTFSRMWFIKG